MNGKLKWFQYITVHPEPVEGETIALSNSLYELNLDLKLNLIIFQG